MPNIASSVARRGARTWARHSMFGAVIACVLGFAHGCGASVFECASSAECQGTSEVGTCQPEGWCSFADPDCASGQRFGDRAPSGIAGECVDAAGDSSGVGGTEATSATSASSTTVSSTTSTSTTAGSTTDPMTSTAPDTTESASDTEITTSIDTGDDPVCGNGIVERGEACEPEDVNGESGGCRDDCQFHACGDGVLGPEEACDGPDFNGSTCQNFGFQDGMLACLECQISTAECQGCDEMDCSQSCQGDDNCDPGEVCVVAGAQVLGSCWPTCIDDGDCPFALMGTQCFFLEQGPVCLYPCDMNEGCPNGLVCTALEGMSLACL